MNKEEEYLDNIERENLKLASTSKRILSFIIDDFTIIFIISLAASNQLSLATNIEEVSMILSSFTAYALVLKFLYQSIFIHYYGQTIGKMVAKIKVIDVEMFDKPSIKASAIRSITRMISEIIIYIGFLFFFTSTIKQTMHDKASKVIVVEA